MRLARQNVDPEVQGVAPTNNNRRVIHTTCRTHIGARGFCNLLMTKVDGSIVLDPHVTGSCVIELDEDGATAMRDALMVWLE